jgi:hypothetical protein
MNQIGNPGAQAIGEALAANTTLTELHLRFNRIEDPEGSQAVADGLFVNLSMTTLSVQNGNNSGIKALLQRNRTLKGKRLSRLLSLSEAIEEPCSAFFDGQDLFSLLSRSVKRALFNIDATNIEQICKIKI